MTLGSKEREFDLSSPLVCEGIIGDGCGGGRIFFISDKKLKVYDAIVDEEMVLLEDIFNAIKIKKSGCIISIEFEDELIEFDLSSMGKIKRQI